MLSIMVLYNSIFKRVAKFLKHTSKISSKCPHSSHHVFLALYLYLFIKSSFQPYNIGVFSITNLQMWNPQPRGIKSVVQSYINSK